MLLSDFIKSLVDVATDYGECEVYLTTEKETKMYDAALVHYLAFNRPVLRIEGITAPAEDEEKEEDDG